MLSMILCATLIPTADSTNAAEVAQAAILASQQKKQKQTGSTPAVVSAAPVLHKPGQQTVAPAAAAQEYTQYRTCHFNNKL
jgi:hypothetical protein